MKAWKLLFCVTINICFIDPVLDKRMHNCPVYFDLHHNCKINDVCDRLCYDTSRHLNKFC